MSSISFLMILGVCFGIFFPLSLMHLKRAFSYCRKIIQCPPNSMLLVSYTIIDVLVLSSGSRTFSRCVQMPFWWLITLAFSYSISGRVSAYVFARTSEVSVKLNEKKHKLMNCSALGLWSSS